MLDVDPSTRGELWAHSLDFSSATVLIAGDLMLDRFVYGDIDRISPEAPVPVLRQSSETRMLGGAGNVAANVASLGARPCLVGLVGDDLSGVEVRAICAASGISDKWLVCAPERLTITKTRFIAQRQQLLRFDLEARACPTSAEFREILISFERALAEADLVVLSDYGKGVLLGGVAEEMIRRARSAKVEVLVDPKGSSCERYIGASFVTPNAKELREITGMSAGDDNEVAAAGRNLLEQVGARAVIATRGEQGMSVIDEVGADHIPTQAQEIFDVSGAGDTVVAVLAVGLAASIDLRAAAAIANVAAGIVVSKVGTAVVTRDELADALQSLRPGSTNPIASAEDAVRLVESWARDNLTIGFTNGCFDILHAGHVSLLEQAKSHCDRLVVGLNSDSSVRQLKGPTRPINNELARGVVLKALRTVDLVVVFDEPTPEALIRSLKPDVLIKGSDYKIEEVAGAEFVLSRGGRVELATMLIGESTTGMVARMQPQAPESST